MSTRGQRFDLIVTIAGVLAFMLAIAWLAADELEFNDIIDSNPIPTAIGYAATIATALFLIAGVGAIHQSQRERAGGLGKAAYVITVAGLVLFAISLIPLWVVGWLLLHVGAILLGWSVLRAGVLPKGAGWLLILGPPVGLIGGAFLEEVILGEQGWGAFLGSIAIAIGYIWLAVAASNTNEAVA